MESVVPIQGKHVVLDIFDGNSEKLNDPDFVVNALKEAAAITGATVLKEDFVKFEPEGVTAFLILAESHFSCHLWPTERFGAWDFYTCGNCDPTKAMEHIVKAFEATKYECMVIDRGTPTGSVLFGSNPIMLEETILSGEMT